MAASSLMGGLEALIFSSQPPHAEVSAEVTRPEDTHNPGNISTVRRNYIRRQFQTLLGRLPDSGEEEMFMDWTQVTEADITNHLRNLDEYYRRTHVPKYSTQLGGDPTTFGMPDYIQALREGGQYNTQQTRGDVLAWLTDIHTGQRFLRPSQKPGGSTASGRAALYDLIAGEGENRTINTSWGDYSLSPEAGEWFGKADLLATRAMGFSDLEIQEWLDENMHTLRDRNQPDQAGGVYEAVRSGTPLSWETPTPTITRNPDQFSARPGESVPYPGTDHPLYQNLQINPSNTGPGIGNLPAGTGGVRRRSGKPRPKYTSTKDLSRERRQKELVKWVQPPGPI